ncbi:MAG: D-alanine--D-alanine ligase family protein, partial [Solirubrobacteraceae bacterium]
AVGGAKGGERAGMQSARRRIPAPIDERTTRRVQELACRAFTAFGSAGVTRVDFLIDAQGQVFVNELNTIPGSFSFYLWEPAGLAFVDLMDELIDLALAEHAEKARTTRVFASSLLSERAGGGKR